MTFPGKWFLVLTVGVGAAAINTGNNLLYLALSMNLSLIILSGILSECCLRRLRVRVAHAPEAFASRESLLAVTCSTEGKRFPALSVSVSPGLPGAGKRAWFPEIPPGESETRVIPYRPGRRGTVPPFLCTVSTRFPFALFEKSAEVHPRGSPLIVYPEPTGAWIAALDTAPGDDSGGKTAGKREGTSIRGARDHLPSDPVRDIHWKASARLGKWMVKEREAEPAQVVDLHLPFPLPAEAFERLVSEACGLVLRCEREGVPFRLRLGDRILVDPADGERRRKALSILARVEPDGTILPLEEGGSP
ncbi:MAG TPA: DUF58 domain-containing protein [Candidatus Deferrimicrobiaceae bacterium]|nr:DUF58 domain-containing protein [Candidatus Deferrimicrobiaceae bacterium]